LSGNATRIANGEPPLEPTKPKGGDELTQPTIMARIHQYLSMAIPLMWTRQADTIGVLGLALNTTDSPSNGYREETEQIRELLETAKELWVTALSDDEDGGAHPQHAHRLAADSPGGRRGGDRSHE
jgi:hypothetical protein